MRRRRGVDMNVMVKQKLLQHLPCGHQEVAVTSLAPELERVLRWGVIDVSADRRLDVWYDRNLEFSFDPVNECGKFCRIADERKVGTSWHSHISLEWDVILCECQKTNDKQISIRTSNIVAAIWTWLSGPNMVTTSEAVSLSGNLTREFVFASMSRIKMLFSPRRVRWYLRGMETVSFT